MKLTIIIPVFNERDTIGEIINLVKRSPLDKEIIIVDDASTDGTREFLQRTSDSDVKVLYHSRNRGKGAAVRSAIEASTGDIIIIQDADLEYSPEDYPALIEPILAGKADAVYGSRFLGSSHAFFFWNYIGNRFLTFLTNILYGAALSDMETCYKTVRANVLKSLILKSERFDIEPEITAKLCKNGFRIREIPIHYRGRGYEAGKKITWKDGIKALWTLAKYRFMD